MALTIIAAISAKPGLELRLKIALQALVPDTLKETGCLSYVLHEDNQNAGHFVFIESWADYDTWQAHLKSPHSRAFSELAPELVEKVEISELAPLS